MSVAATLPIESLRAAVLESIDTGPVVVSAPTGSGKSTQIPRWLRTRGRVLVVEPRRVAARALATRVAELEGVTAGREVGWVVRDEVRRTRRPTWCSSRPGWRCDGRRPVASRRSAVWCSTSPTSGMDLDLLLALCVRDHAPVGRVPTCW